MQVTQRLVPMCTSPLCEGEIPLIPTIIFNASSMLYQLIPLANPTSMFVSQEETAVNIFNIGGNPKVFEILLEIKKAATTKSCELWKPMFGLCSDYYARGEASLYQPLIYRGCTLLLTKSPFALNY